MSEKLGYLKWWWLGGIYSPNHQTNRWGGCLSMGAPDSLVRQPCHPTVRVLTVLTVGALTSWGTDSPVPHRTGTVHCPVRLLALLWLYTNCPRTVHVAGDRWSRLLRFLAIAPLAHRTVRWIIAEWRLRNSKVRSSVYTAPGAPDTVRWRTGHCPVAHRTVRCARPGFSSVSFAPFFWTLILMFLLVCVEPLAPVEYIV
jgi:hypothetical protein